MLSFIRELSEFQTVCERIQAKEHTAFGSLGLIHSARYITAAALLEELQRPILYLTDRPEKALLALDEIGFWQSNSDRFHFPAPEPHFYENAAWSMSVRHDRIQTLTQLSRLLLPGTDKPEKPPLITAPIRAVMQRTLSRKEFIHSLKILRIGQEISSTGLLRVWSCSGYEAAEAVLEPGQYSRRGELLDVWPHSEPYPIRIDFFGDEIDSIHRFDPATQRNIVPLQKVIIPPAGEVIFPENTDLGIQPNSPRDFYLPVIHKNPASLLDYLPANTLILCDDLEAVRSIAEDLEEEAENLRRESISIGTLDSDYPEPYISFSELNDRMGDFCFIDLGRSDVPDSSYLSDSFTPADRFGGHLDTFLNFLQARYQAKEPVTIVSRQAERIEELWKKAAANRAGQNGCIPVFHEDSLAEGFILTTNDGSKNYVMTDSEIFGWERPAPRKNIRKAIDAPEKYFADLKEGDYVVHVDFGIGIYDGLISRTIDGVKKDFLRINYAEGDQLFVPVHQADRLSNYVGPNGKIPEITRLGTKDWLNSKNFVREKVLEIANDLLDLYAKRQITPGYAFSKDNIWMKDLEGAFPFEETEDQKIAIRKVKEDMESPRPMDRLICGDVGYGKTEIALRAAFKAACDSKQVAVLVPTTVLAQQHYETFKKRFAAYPVNVEMLSRFRTTKEQNQIIKKLETGEIDIIIGTHRLVSKDVKFKDLGLVLIDEEQRFGVRQKEYLKKLRAHVDVLTLTATPIPRTLYMALTGVRDISNINTPPYERVPITTYVGPYSEKIIRQAITREMERNGQTFFLHNRVQSIYAMNDYLHRLIPEARIGVAHGQMAEKQLSAVMDQFYKGDLDVLLCTSIIESGLDVPNANTLIVNRADTFGLAQLYQIRGRVGRSSQRAYAYFFRQKGKPTEAGLERLEVIAENTQFGAGYTIAMRDLEMRGAGEILGSRQHGAIASVGFHLYTRMLAQAVRNVRDIKGVDVSDEDLGITREMAYLFNPITVELPLNIGIPESYIEDDQTRIKLYRRMASVNKEEELDALDAEFTDRFGPLPAEIRNLIFQIRIKIFAEQIGLSAVVKEGNDIVLKFPPLPANMDHRDLPLISKSLRIGKNNYRMISIDWNSDEWQDKLLGILAILALKLHK
ncbi:MAG: transcription-repair coupling factor [Anaerolineaceae bacterium]|nr:transcription-repair coupling factor [Anaerolineaceae bacterium]